MCYEESSVSMLVNVHEIPYFGEQTELTLACRSCGWRKTDFIAGDGGEPEAWTIPINSDTLDGRVVRSSSCTVSRLILIVVFSQRNHFSNHSIKIVTK